MHILVLVIIFVILIKAIEYWPVVLGTVGVGLGIYMFVRKEREDRARKDREAYKEKQAREFQEHLDQECKRKHNEVRLMGNEFTIEAPHNATECLVRVEEGLENADRFFRERAYSLFWDSAQQGLTWADLAIGNREYYKKRLQEYNAAAICVTPRLEPLDLKFDEFEIFHTLKRDLRSLIERAHRDNQFVKVYEARIERAAALKRIAEEIQRAADEDDGD